MNLRVPRGQAVGLLVICVIAVAVFVYLMGRFGGPSIQFGERYRVPVVVPDTQGLAVKSDVLVRGVKVGEVARIERNGRSPTVTLEVADRYAPLRRDASVRIGQKTLLGEAYVDLYRGHGTSAELPAGERIEKVVQAVELDEALAPFVGGGGRSLQSVLGTFARGARSEHAAERFNETLGQVRPLVTRIRRLTALLRGQEGDIAAGVKDGRTVVAELGRREGALRTIVTEGRATLGATASQRRSLEAALAELPRLLAVARLTLVEARPLLLEARPLVADLRAAAPELTPALEDLRPIARDARVLLTGLPRFNDRALPFLDRLEPVVAAARPAARRLGPALANLVPIVRYLKPRRNSLAAWFANTADIGLNGDDKGKWVRFFLFRETGTSSGGPGKFANNAYTKPGDAADNQPYEPGSYPRLRPFRP